MINYFDWVFNNAPLREVPSGAYGFVYRITNLRTGMMYIGKKFFWSKRTMPPLKGKTLKRHSLVESDWRTYYGSSAELLKDLEEYGKGSFKREILGVYTNKWDCAYQELKTQITEDVLFRSEYYNNIINVRLHGPKNFKKKTL